MPWTSSVFYQTLLKHGVRIFEYVPGVLHAKTLIVDDWMTVGSSNLNRRSLLHDLEVDAVVGDSATKRELKLAAAGSKESDVRAACRDKALNFDCFALPPAAVIKSVNPLQ